VEQQREWERQQGADWRTQQQAHFERDRNQQRIRAREAQERRWGDLRERNWSEVREWGPGFEHRQYYRGPDWDDWRRRHYTPRPRYYWHDDRYSRPWFDYGSVTYVEIYRPTYIIPYDAYDDYGTSYYGPVACDRDVVGAVLGGVAGALIGSHNGGGAAVGGAIVGAILGGALGEAVDMSDQACYGQVLEYVPNNQPVYWDDDGAQYQVTPLRTYQNEDGLYCREYQTSIYIDGYPQDAYGKACRQPDGSWQLVD
jgi:surface antigen